MSELIYFTNRWNELTSPEVAKTGDMHAIHTTPTDFRRGSDAATLERETP